MSVACRCQTSSSVSKAPRCRSHQLQESTHADTEGKGDEDEGSSEAGLQDVVQPNPPAEVRAGEATDQLAYQTKQRRQRASPSALHAR